MYSYLKKLTPRVLTALSLSLKYLNLFSFLILCVIALLITYGTWYLILMTLV